MKRILAVSGVVCTYGLPVYMKNNLKVKPDENKTRFVELKKKIRSKSDLLDDPESETYDGEGVIRREIKGKVDNDGKGVGEIEEKDPLEVEGKDTGYDKGEVEGKDTGDDEGEIEEKDPLEVEGEDTGDDEGEGKGKGDKININEKIDPYSKIGDGVKIRDGLSDPQRFLQMLNDNNDDNTQSVTLENEDGEKVKLVKGHAIFEITHGDGYTEPTHNDLGVLPEYTEIAGSDSIEDRLGVGGEDSNQAYLQPGPKEIDMPLVSGKELEKAEDLVHISHANHLAAIRAIEDLHNSRNCDKCK